MGNTFSRPKQKIRRLARASCRKSGRDTLHRSHCHTRHPRPVESRSSGSSRRRGNARGTMIPVPEARNMTSPLLYGYRCPESRLKFLSPRHIYYGRGESGLRGRYHGDGEPPPYVTKLRLDPNNPSLDTVSRPMPHAPMPPGWDDRFYAGIPREHVCNKVQGSQHRQTRHRRDRSKRDVRRGGRTRARVYIDIEDYVWRGVPVDLVDANPASGVESTDRRPVRWTMRPNADGCRLFRGRTARELS
jgi:hypothetical protein